MVLTTTGKNAIRDEINSALTNGQMGTDSTAPVPSDTGLGTPVSATQLAVTTSTADKQITTTYNLNSTTGNGNTLVEYENQIGTGNSNLSRTTFAAISKTSDIEINVVTTYFIK